MNSERNGNTRYRPFPIDLVEELERLTRDRENPPINDTPKDKQERQAGIDRICAELRSIPSPREGDIVVGSKLVRTIGKGNYGTVWQAIDTNSGEPVAVKIFDSDRLGLSLALYHFRRGVRAMEHLNKIDGRPSTIVKLYRVDDAKLAFSMKYLDDGDLTERKESGWSIERKASLFKTICEAVGFAHRNQVLHRDIKPANIVMDRSGKPTLTDFDIADLLFAKTLSAQATGTVHYAAPEQLSGSAKKDPTGDIYSLGRLLHFLLLERDPTFLWEKVPQLEELNGQPRGLVRIIRKCTLYNPDDRYQTIDELLSDLARHRSAPDKVGIDVSDLSDSVSPKEKVVTKPKRMPLQMKIAIISGGFGLIAAGIGIVPTLVPKKANDIDGKSAPPSLESNEDKSHGDTSIDTGSTAKKGEHKTIHTTPGDYELVFVEGDTFQMGSNRSKTEGEVHPVAIKGFYIGKYEVTNQDYKRFLEANLNKVREPEYWEDSRFNDQNKPVVGVSWYEAKQYAKWVGGRLPTEAEWEYACRATTTTDYYSGNSWKDLENVGWYSDNSKRSTHPVGEKDSNAFGLYDMHGNVWEWVEDDWHDSYQNAPKDGTAWIDDPRGEYRVLRGGSWGLDPGLCRSATRNYNYPDVRLIDNGFRVVLDLK